MTYETFLGLAFLGKIAASFGGGIISFISPCILPLVPSYISFITGISFEELTDEEGAKKLKGVIIANSIMFILGFSTVFILVLGLSAQIFGNIFFEYKDILRKVGGIAIILLGIHVIGVINIGILQRDKRLHFFREKPPGLIGSFLVGVGFAAGWTPCLGPILSAIFAVAATSDGSSTGIILFISYSMGLAVPFLLTSLAINTFLKHFQRVKKHLRMVSVITGIFLMITGGLIFFNSFAIITAYLTGLHSILPDLG